MRAVLLSAREKKTRVIPCVSIKTIVENIHCTIVSVDCIVSCEPRTLDHTARPAAVVR